MRHVVDDVHVQVVGSTLIHQMTKRHIKQMDMDESDIISYIADKIMYGYEGATYIKLFGERLSSQESHARSVHLITIPPNTSERCYM